MSDYKPIASRSSSGGVGLRDKVISIKKTDFTAAPQLNYLTAYQETITAAVVYYNPSNPTISNTAPVNYRINRSITTLSEEPVKFRHNGDTVDMELSVDNYVFLQSQPIVAPYSTNPELPAISEGDSYERSTMLYIYNQVPVPKASNKIWDGRYLKCVDLEGNDVDPSSRVVKVKKEVKDILENPGAVYSVQPVAGRGTTINPPKKDPYAATYRVKLQEFIAINYNSLGLTRHPRGKADTDIYQEIPAEVRGTGKYEFAEGFVAAVLDGDYFVKWANVYRYKEIERPATPEELYDCCHIIESYEPDGDEVIILGCKCGVEPPEEIPVPPDNPVNNYANILRDKFPPGTDITINEPQEEVIVIPYINTNNYFSSVPLNPPTKVGYGLSAFINLKGLPAGTTVYLNDKPYNVSNGGIIYDFPLDVVTGQPIIPNSLSVNIIFNHVPSPTLITVVTTFIQPVLPSVQKSTYNTLYRYNSVVTYRMESLLDSNIFEIVTHTPSHPDSIKVESLTIQIQDNLFGLVASGFPIAQAVAGSLAGIEFNAAYYGVNPSGDSVSVVMSGNNQIASAPSSFNGTLKVTWLSTEVTELINNQILSIPSNTTLVSDVFIDGVRINPVTDYVVNLDSNVVTVYDIATLYKNSVIDIYYFT